MFMNSVMCKMLFHLVNRPYSVFTSNMINNYIWSEDMENSDIIYFFL